RALFRRFGGARRIVNCALDASDARLRIVVVHPRDARGIGAASSPASLSIAGHAIEVAQIGDDTRAIGMLLGAFHLADHLLPDRGPRATLGNEFLADSLG